MATSSRAAGSRTASKHAAPRDAAPLSLEESTRLLEDLRVHQVELEMQNQELRRAQAELERSRERYFDLYDLAPVGYLTVSEAGVIVEANLAAATLLGEARPRLQGRTLAHFLLVDDRELHRRHHAALFETGEAQIWEARLAAPDGTLRWIRLHATLAHDAAGGRTMRAAATDISDQRRAEQQRRRLAAALEQTPASVMITDAQGRLEYVNAAFERVSGYTREEVLGQNPRLRKSGLQDPGVYQALWRAISAGETWQGRLINRTKAGTLVTEDTIIAPVRDERGAIASHVAVARDISHELQLQQQLAESNKLESLGRLAGGIAHDFNNILAVILLAVDCLRPELASRPDELAQLTLEIRQAGARAGDLTRQLLGFARKQVFAPLPLDLNLALRNVQSLLRRLLGESVTLETRLAPGLGPVRCDPSQLEQVVLNLAVNARDAMGPGGRLTLTTSAVSPGEPAALAYPDLPPGDFVQLTVSDTGAGMSPEVVAHAFDPFFTTKAVGQGSGLGLATVHGIVKQNGGAIRCESTPGAGATFLLCLPRVEGPAQPLEAPAASPARFRGSETVLLVEDEPAVRRAAVRALENGGYRVRVASDGRAALALARSERGALDLVITDVIMPGMGGAQLVEALEAVYPGLPALLVSGYPADAISEHGVLRQGIEFLAKPFSGAQLLARVRALLDAAQAWPPSF